MYKIVTYFRTDIWIRAINCAVDHLNTYYSSLQTPQDISLKPVVCKTNDTLIFRTLVQKKLSQRQSTIQSALGLIPLKAKTSLNLVKCTQVLTTSADIYISVQIGTYPTYLKICKCASSYKFSYYFFCLYFPDKIRIFYYLDLYF